MIELFLLIEQFILFICDSGSVGGVRPCQGRGRGFESRLSLSRKRATNLRFVAHFAEWGVKKSL